MSVLGLLSEMGGVADRYQKNRTAQLQQDQALHDSMVASENERVKRLRNEEALRAAKNQPLPQFTPEPGTGWGMFGQQPTAQPAPPTDVGGGNAKLNSLRGHKGSGQRAPVATDSNAIEVSEASNRLQALRRADTQALRDRRALLAAPAAAADVFQAPMAGALNVFGDMVSGAQNLANRVGNAVVGRDVLRTDTTLPKYNLTPFTTMLNEPEAKIDAAAARLKSLQGAGSPAAPTPGAAQAPATAQAPAVTGKSQYDAPTKYDQIIAQAAQQNGIDPTVLKRLLGTESSFREDAVAIGANGKRHLGIAQISDLHGLTDEQRMNPAVAIPFAAQLFSKYLRESGGDYQQALLRYKGATSPQGIQAMMKPIGEILSGLVPSAQAQTPAAPGAAPAPVAPSFTAPAGQVGGLDAGGEMQSIQMLRMQMQEAQFRLQNARTPEEAYKAREALVTGQLGIAGATSKKLARDAIQNDESLAALARTVGVPFVQTPQGFMPVQPGANGQYVPQPGAQAMDRMSFINALYQRVQAALTEVSKEERVAMINAQSKVAEEQVKGVNDLRKLIATGEINLQTEMAKYQMTADAAKGIETNPMTGQTLVYTPRGVLELVKGEPQPNGLTSAPYLRPLVQR